MNPCLLPLLLVLAVTGCTHGTLARQLVRAPNRQSAPPFKAGAMTAGFTAVPVPGREPGVVLDAQVIEPGDWRLAYACTVERTKRALTATIQMSYDKPGAFTAAPKGTVILLHGYRQQKEQMLPWALSLAQRGYRCVLVDLRGHGASTGEWIGFGAFEVEDMRSVLDALTARRLVAGKVGVMGVSLGASVGIQWAGADPRVVTVVALEPFADPRSAIDTMIHAFDPFRRRLWWASEGTIRKAIAEAPGKAGFTWADVDVPKAAAAVSGPILFIHGADDAMVPPEHSRRLSARAPAGSRLLLLPGEDHITLPLRLQPTDGIVQEWFDRNLAENPPAQATWDQEAVRSMGRSTAPLPDGAPSGQ